MRPYDLTTHDGKRVDAITDQALNAAEKILGYDLTVTQGSYNAGRVSASAGTHDGGGVVDLAPWDWANKVKVLRRVGFAAWHRLPSQGPWPEHIHAVLIGNDKLAPSAQRQADAYLAGRNGLASNAPDDGPREFTSARYTWVDPDSRGARVDHAIDDLKAAKGGPRRRAKIKAALKILRRIATKGRT